MFSVLDKCVFASGFLGYTLFYVVHVVLGYASSAFLSGSRTLANLTVENMKPTYALLQKDLRRMGAVLDLDSFSLSKYANADVVRYYASTSSRDYALLAWATFTESMHTQLAFLSGGKMEPLYFVMPHLGSSACRVMEIGMGKGANLRRLSEMLPSVSLFGMDVVPEHVHATRARLEHVPNYNFLIADASNPPPESSQILQPLDVIFGVESFCHLDSDARLVGFLRFAHCVLKSRGKVVVVDGFRSSLFDVLPAVAQEAMNLAESGFRIRRMASKETWKWLAHTAGFQIVDEANLTAEALPFWCAGWRVARLLLAFFPSLLRTFFKSSSHRAETGANFVAVMMTAPAMFLGAAEYGMLVLQKEG